MRLGCLGLIVLIVLIVVLAVIGGSKVSVTSGTNSGGTPKGGQTACTPAPCAIESGYTLQVSGVNRNLPPSEFNNPETGNHFVAMQVTLTNGGDSSQSANPFDFKLRDASGVAHDIAFSLDPQCTTWAAVDIAKGGKLGPKPLCFEASGPPAAKLTLVWSPGFFNSPLELDLP